MILQLVAELRSLGRCECSIGVIKRSIQIPSAFSSKYRLTIVKSCDFPIALCSTQFSQLMRVVDRLGRIGNRRLLHQLRKKSSCLAFPLCIPGAGAYSVVYP